MPEIAVNSSRANTSWSWRMRPVQLFNAAFSLSGAAVAHLTLGEAANMGWTLRSAAGTKEIRASSQSKAEHEPLSANNSDSHSETRQSGKEEEKRE
jgi:hypothetical protein